MSARFGGALSAGPLPPPQVVSTLRFWVAAEQPTVVARRRRIQQPLSLLLQLLAWRCCCWPSRNCASARRPAPAAITWSILDTSAWMGARSGNRTLLMDWRAHARARYVRACPARDRIMLVRADALATPATAFEPDRRNLKPRSPASQPGATALNLEQALAFARQIQARSGRRAGEIVFVGTGQGGTEPGTLGRATSASAACRTPSRIAACEDRRAALGQLIPRSGRFTFRCVTTVRAAQCHLALSSARSTDGPGWLSDAAAHSAARRRREASFTFRIRAAGFCRRSLRRMMPFPPTITPILQLPAQPHSALSQCTRTSRTLLRPVLSASPTSRPHFARPRNTAPRRPALVILDRFIPPASAGRFHLDRSAGGWLARPGARAASTDVPFDALACRTIRWGRACAPRISGWNGHGLRSRAGRLENRRSGARSRHRGAPRKPKIVVLGFHPALSPMRYELATPLLFANFLRWMAPEIFRRWELTGGSVGTVKVAMDPDAPVKRIVAWCARTARPSLHGAR